MCGMNSAQVENDCENNFAELLNVYCINLIARKSFVAFLLLTTGFSKTFSILQVD